jgi:hypothetical protein
VADKARAGFVAGSSLLDDRLCAGDVVDVAVRVYDGLDGRLEVVLAEVFQDRGREAVD